MPPSAAPASASAPGAAGVATWRQDAIYRAFESSSTSRAPPGVSFGTAPRASLASANAAGVPGPGQYAVPSDLIKRGGGFSLRGRVRFGSVYGDNADSRTKDTRPGPGHYATTNATAKGGRAFSPAHSFPKAGPRQNPQRLQPGPGHYAARSALEGQVLSTKRNAPAATFGRSKAQQRAGLGGDGVGASSSSRAQSPGPGEYGRAGVPACSPRQVESRKRSQGGFRFGTTAKDPLAAPSRLQSCGPPNGHALYTLPSAICVSGKGAPYRAAPAFSLSGRERFRSPF